MQLSIYSHVFKHFDTQNYEVECSVSARQGVGPRDIKVIGHNFGKQNTVKAQNVSSTAVFIR